MKKAILTLLLKKMRSSVVDPGQKLSQVKCLLTPFSPEQDIREGPKQEKCKVREKAFFNSSSSWGGCFFPSGDVVMPKGFSPGF